MVYYSGTVSDIQVVLRSLAVGSGSLDALNDTQVEESQKKVDGDINAALYVIYYTPLSQITRSGLTAYPDPIPAMARRLVAADLILNTMTGVDQNVIQTAKNIAEEETRRLYELGNGLVGASRLSGQLLKARNRFAPPGVVPSPLPVQRT